jgi:hypothetical protein
MKRIALLTLPLLFGLAAPGSAFQTPTLLLDQPPSGQNLVYSDAVLSWGGQQSLAEDIVLSTPGPVDVTELVFWGAYLRNDVAGVDQFTVNVYDDVAGQPGALLVSEFQPALVRTATGAMVGSLNWTQYRYELTFASPVRLDAGRYWIEIYNSTDVTTGSDDWTWETGTPDTVGGTTGYLFSTTTPGATWYPPTGSGNGVALQVKGYEVLGLFTDQTTISLASGGVQILTAVGGSEHALKTYFTAGSVTGTSPGLPFGGVTVPLNPDPYLLYTLANPNSPPLSGGFGTLNSLAQASLQFVLPSGSDPSLAGAVVNHAFVVLDLATLAVDAVSPPTPCSLLP